MKALSWWQNPPKSRLWKGNQNAQRKEGELENERNDVAFSREMQDHNETLNSHQSVQETNEGHVCYKRKGRSDNDQSVLLQ